MHKYLAIGCSHTRASYLPWRQRWTETIREYIGKPFSYRLTCRIASGLIHLQRRTHDLFKGQAKQVKWLVIQKPQALRFPWWIHNWENHVSPSSYDKHKGIDMVAGRKWSLRKYRKLNKKDRQQVADTIFAEEYKCLLKLQELFVNAKIAYFHYWGDYIMDSLNCPELAEVNVRLGEAITSHGIENWKMIIDLKDVPTLYDAEGDIAINVEKLHELGWVYNDLHAGHVYHNHVLDKVRGWIIS